LVTVGLSEKGHLHPAQEAMIECHGSQCGFCTLGIVMSLFTLHSDLTQRPAPLLQELLPERLEAALGGNLCRCTGYRAIRDAALRMNDTPYERPQWYDATLPASESEVQTTDFGWRLLSAWRRSNQLIDVSRVAELQTVEEATHGHQTGWWIGAGVTYTQLEPLFEKHFPAFAHLLHRLGSQQIRNRGTLGGNIANASPIGDTPPVLLNLSVY
jgi:xanthine dehydrogenase small subunit|tara:strand:+ start:13661 stop:14299 length:639 start_codon:yes stop_codon:yes gene_type:complete